MTIPDLEPIHRLAPVVDALPGESVPYYLAGGEGLRIETFGQLWTVIARSCDTGDLFDAATIRGPRGASAPFHTLDRQRSYHVTDGAVRFWLPGRSRLLVSGDSVHVPPGVAVAYRFEAHGAAMLLWSAPGGALDELVATQRPVARHIYRAGRVAAGGTPIGVAVTEDFTEIDDRWDETLPPEQSGYFLRGGTGERLAWPDALNVFTARGCTTGGHYFAVATTGGRRPYIPRHFHRLHTENFFCTAGRVWLWVNGHEMLLTPGDFVHAPAGTVHSFAFGAHNTGMLGILSSDVFEPFFEVTGEPTDDHVYTEGLIDPSAMEARLAHALDELDLMMVGPPPRRTVAPGL
ncbi:quercetin 2,3-dioxygenase [Nocardia transvalensis]|uniref:quercetin 2,3-dioxygenase n=1 Tax=Nocardia transvalensis TaxID=37333 RepID=UPI001892F8C9|nr:quercetin 2,3-dioxygenase [Nocardia transvalensis]MBF6328272.1 quercetin 2,3-dioxygenase [Nocardia transvalensis]